jgi:hypothetical protein
LEKVFEFFVGEHLVDELEDGLRPLQKKSIEKHPRFFGFFSGCF